MPGSSFWNQKIVRVVFLVFAAATVIATSAARDYVPDPILNWVVLSSCPGAIPSEIIATQGSSIIVPANRTFLQYGLPVERLFLGSTATVSGSDGTTTRECLPTKVEISGKQVETYTCVDNLIPACVVSFEPRTD